LRQLNIDEMSMMDGSRRSHGTAKPMGGSSVRCSTRRALTGGCMVLKGAHIIVAGDPAAGVNGMYVLIAGRTCERHVIAASSDCGRRRSAVSLRMCDRNKAQPTSGELGSV
jgi:hypothetical protein